MKTIMLPIHEDDGADARMRVALDLARANEGHVRCLQVTPYNAYIASDAFGGVFVLPGLIDAVNREMERLRAETEARLAREGVSWTYEHCEGESAAAIVDRSTLADLIILSPALRHAGPREALPLAGDVAVHARTPVLTVPSAATGFDVADRAFVAWNGSPEAASALKAALPMLRLASAVAIATVTETGTDVQPAMDAGEYLARHGIKADFELVEAGRISIAEALLTARERCGAGYVVMGAYGHTRLREFILGGTTRQMLRDCPVPIFMAH